MAPSVCIGYPSSPFSSLAFQFWGCVTYRFFCAESASSGTSWAWVKIRIAQSHDLDWSVRKLLCFRESPARMKNIRASDAREKKIDFCIWGSFIVSGPGRELLVSRWGNFPNSQQLCKAWEKFPCVICAGSKATWDAGIVALTIGSSCILLPVHLAWNAPLVLDYHITWFHPWFFSCCFCNQLALLILACQFFGYQKTP